MDALRCYVRSRELKELFVLLVEDLDQVLHELEELGDLILRVKILHRLETAPKLVNDTLTLGLHDRLQCLVDQAALYHSRRGLLLLFPFQLLMQSSKLLGKLYLGVSDLVFELVNCGLLLLDDLSHAQTGSFKLLGLLFTLRQTLGLHLRGHLLVIGRLVLIFFISSGFFFHLNLQILKQLAQTGSEDRVFLVSFAEDLA